MNEDVVDEHENIALSAIQESSNSEATNPTFNTSASTKTYRPASFEIYKHHFKILLAVFFVLLCLGLIIILSPCSDGFFMGMCFVIKAFYNIFLLGLFAIWAAILTTCQFIYWKKKQKVLGLRWYLLIFIALILLYSGWMRFNSLFGSQISEWRSNLYLNDVFCMGKDGPNVVISGEYREDVECANGKLNGKYFRYRNDQLIYQATYKNGKLDGIEFTFNDDGSSIETNFKEGKKVNTQVYYDSLGATKQYILNDPEKEYGENIYFLRAENVIAGAIGSLISEETQNYLCSLPVEARNKIASFTCNGLKIVGSYKEHISGTGEVYEEFNLDNGVLNGPAMVYKNNEVRAYAEYKNGKLDGKVYEVGIYEGQYVNGLQEGVFKMYKYTGELESEVRFEKGRLVEVIFYKKIDNNF